MAETLVKCPCGSDMGEARYKGLQTCPHCDGTICPDFGTASFSSRRCSYCANLINSMTDS